MELRALAARSRRLGRGLPDQVLELPEQRRGVGLQAGLHGARIGSGLQQLDEVRRVLFLVRVEVLDRVHRVVLVVEAADQHDPVAAAARARDDDRAGAASGHP